MTDDCSSAQTPRLSTQNALPPCPAAERIRQYFAGRYPRRNGRAISKLFRQGEGDRLRLLRTWMPEWDGLAVLDAGCGDGAFMHDLLHGHPAYVRLEDFVQSWTVMAYGRLLQDADRVEAVTTDVRTVDDATLYDVVLALGVFDYDSDWPGLLHRLMCRSKGIVVADFPRAGTLHSWVRQIWLGAHGINLQSTNRKRLDLLFERVGASAQVEELPLQWIARIRISH